MIWHPTTRRETERVLRSVRPLDWHCFAPLFRPEWEHLAELDLTPLGAIEDPAIAHLRRSPPLLPKARSSATTIICWRVETSCPSAFCSPAGSSQS